MTGNQVPTNPCSEIMNAPEYRVRDAIRVFRRELAGKAWSQCSFSSDTEFIIALIFWLENPDAKGLIHLTPVSDDQWEIKHLSITAGNNSPQRSFKGFEKSQRRNLLEITQMVKENAKLRELSRIQRSPGKSVLTEGWLENWIAPLVEK